MSSHTCRLCARNATTLQVHTSIRILKCALVAACCSRSHKIKFQLHPPSVFTCSQLYFYSAALVVSIFIPFYWRFFEGISFDKYFHFIAFDQIFPARSRYLFALTLRHQWTHLFPATATRSCCYFQRFRCFSLITDCCRRRCCCCCGCGCCCHFMTLHQSFCPCNT